MTRADKTTIIINRLFQTYPQAKTALTYTNAFELLIATILSAQTTDKVVNLVTPSLFAKFKTASDFAKAPVEEIDVLIKKVNFHNNKAKNIKATAQILRDKYNGHVPDTLIELTALPGVARKTANVVLGTIYNKAEGIVVDTHVMRLTKRLGLSLQKTPEKIEKDLMTIVPKDKWILFSHLLILYGREYCPARPHICADCPLGNLCPDTQTS